jgi:hypothetical protein
MSFQKTISHLYNSQNFVGLLHRRLKKLSRELKVELEFNDYAARQAAAQWRQLLASKFNFQEAEYDLLIEEIIGELICIIALSDKLILPVKARVQDPFASAVISYAKEFIALDIAVEIYRRVFKDAFRVSTPTPQLMIEAAATLRQDPTRSHRYCSWLRLELREL